MARLRQNFQGGTITGLLPAAGTTLSSPQLATVVAVTGGDILPVVLDPAGAHEIVYITARTAGATTATILREQEGTTAADHIDQTPWLIGPLAADLAGMIIGLLASGNATVVNNGDGTWTVGTTGLLTLDGNSAHIQPVGHTASAGTQTLAAKSDHAHVGVKSVIAGNNIIVTDNGDGTWTVGTSSSSPTNEQLAGALVNATSAGDGGNRSDHFLGGAISGAWAQEAGAATILVGQSLAFFQAIAGSPVYVSRAYTPTGILRVEARLRRGSSVGGIFLMVRDAANGTSGDAMAVAAGQGAPDNYTLWSLDAGVFNLRAQANAPVATEIYTNYVYIALERDGASNWTAFHSLDRFSWQQIGSWNKMFAAVKLALRLDSVGAVLDFVDVVG